MDDERHPIAQSDILTRRHLAMSLLEGDGRLLHSDLKIFLKDLYRKQSEIIEYELKLPDGRTEKKKILYNEVTSAIWDMLMEKKPFKKSADGFFPNVLYANIGGIEVKRGSDFIVRDQTYIREKPQLDRSIRREKRAGRKTRELASPKSPSYAVSEHH